MASTDVEARTATARIELVDYLPGERTVYPVEIEGELVWLVLRGEMTDTLCGEMNEYLDFITGRRLWTQNWAEPRSRAQLRRVS
ncbi:hypothetical protein [Streptomyces globisporus]|uniref:hypothetical protein n=1 Tax=Streptomyces globisporus TaxID=1908 RepID=UPI00345F1E78|nr:hypothetical protein OG838_23830 [Streptomyces globisporus]